MLTELQVNDFLQTVASDAPAPGGGSCASLAGALGCGLASMMCRLTVGKKAYAEVAESDKVRFESAFQKMEDFRTELTALIDKDTEAFNHIMAAFKLPKETDEEKAARSVAIQDATWLAIATPYRMAELSVTALRQLQVLVDFGNANAASDLGVGVLLLNAGLKGANMNVKINLSSVKDVERAEKTRQEIDAFETEADELTKNLLEQIYAKL